MTLALMMVPVALLVLSLVITFVLVKKGVAPKRAMAIHFMTLVVIVLLSAFLTIGVSAAEQAQTAETTQTTAAADNGMKFIGAGLAVGLAGIGGGIAVGGGAPAAIGANVEDPKSFGKSLIFVALGEGFGLYGLLISILCLVL